MADRPVSAATVVRILDSGMRPAPSLIGTIRRLWRDVGPGGLFFGMGVRLLLAGAVSVLTAVLVMQAGDSLGVLFASAPVLLLTLAGFVEGAERFGPLAELRRTVRNSGQQLAAFRMLVFGVAGFLFGIFASILPRGGARQLGQSLTVASLGVVFAGALSLVVLQRVTVRWLGALLPLGWIGFWVAVTVVFGESWDAVLAGLPPLAV